VIHPSVVTEEGRSHAVKNLGWLLRNWKQITRFELQRDHGPAQEALMVAYFPHGHYTTNWASWNLMLAWLDRPIFRGLPVSLDGASDKVGPHLADHYRTYATACTSSRPLR